MKHFGKINLAMLAFMILFMSFGANLAADGSAYFDAVEIEGVPCYIVPEALDDLEVSDDTVFFLPVAVYDGYGAMFESLAIASNSGAGLPEENGEAVTDFLYDVWSNDAYGELCLDSDDGDAVADLWDAASDAYYDDWAEDEPLVVIHNCLPEWAYQMREATWNIVDCLNEVYDFLNGDSYYDSIDDIMESYYDDVLTAVSFIKAYYPDSEL